VRKSLYEEPRYAETTKLGNYLPLISTAEPEDVLNVDPVSAFESFSCIIITIPNKVTL